MRPSKFHHVNVAVAELAKHGASDIDVEPRNGHPTIWFSWNGERRFIRVAGSPSSHLRKWVNSLRCSINHTCLQGITPFGYSGEQFFAWMKPFASDVVAGELRMQRGLADTPT